MIFAWSLSVNEKRANDFYGRSKKSYKCADRFSVIITLQKSHMYQTLVFSVLEHVFLLRGRHPRVHISERPSVNRHWIASNNDRWLNRIILVTSQYMWLDRLNDNSSHWGVLGPIKGISLGVSWCRLFRKQTRTWENAGTGSGHLKRWTTPCASKKTFISIWKWKAKLAQVFMRIS